MDIFYKVDFEICVALSDILSDLNRILFTEMLLNGFFYVLKWRNVSVAFGGETFRFAMAFGLK